MTPVTTATTLTYAAPGWHPSRIPPAGAAHAAPAPPLEVRMRDWLARLTPWGRRRQREARLVEMVVRREREAYEQACRRNIAQAWATGRRDPAANRGHW